MDYLSEYGVAVIQPGGGLDRDEELAPVGIRAGVRHGEPAGLVVLERGVKLVLELVSRAAPAGAGGIAALDHEIGDNPVEDKAVVKGPLGFLPGFGIGIFLFPLGQADEVFNGVRCLFFKEPADDEAVVGFDMGVQSGVHFFLLSLCVLRLAGSRSETDQGQGGQDSNGSSGLHFSSLWFEQTGKAVIQLNFK